VLTGISGIFFAVVAVVLYGVLQGTLRFGALGVSLGASGLAKPLLVVPALLVGFGAAGALLVNTLAGCLAVAIAGFAVRDLWRLEPSGEALTLDGSQMAVLLLGSLAFASLTNVDVLLAAYFLPDDVAGVYAAAALVGKAVLFLPAAIVTVLLPKAATRAAAGVTSRRILLASAGVTAGLTLTVTGLLALVPESLLVWVFGGDFRQATALLPWFGLAMTAAALVSVYLSVYFAERDVWFPALVPLACASGVLLIHEIAFPYALARIWSGRSVEGQL